ncbi:MAG: hypothetical protein ACYDH4_12020 [Candidatus Cryosericum sp.]
MLPGELARFKVFPAGKHRSPCYWTVLVFADRGFMRRAFHQLNITRDKDDRFGAIVMPQELRRLIRGRWKSDPSLGYVLCARTQLCMETQCHESVHMALGYLRRVKQRPRLGKEVTDDEETLAYHAGWCARQLNNAFHKFNCYPK